MSGCEAKREHTKGWERAAGGMGVCLIGLCKEMGFIPGLLDALFGVLSGAAPDVLPRAYSCLA